MSTRHATGSDRSITDIESGGSITSKICPQFEVCALTPKENLNVGLSTNVNAYRGYGDDRKALMLDGSGLEYLPGSKQAVAFRNTAPHLNPARTGPWENRIHEAF